MSKRNAEQSGRSIEFTTTEDIDEFQNMPTDEIIVKL